MMTGTRWLLGLPLSLLMIGSTSAAPPTSAFDTYVAKVEARLAEQHRARTSLATGTSEAKLRQGELVIEHITPPEVSGAMLHHWRGTAFASGATAADFERLMQDFAAYPRHYQPQVLAAKVLRRDGDHFEASMRVRQKHVLTVVLDTVYDVSFARTDARHGHSISRSTQIAEISGAGTRAERALRADEEHGFLWRLNTYWTYEERAEGLYMQIESVSLTRAIPRGLGWIVRPFVESVPRESLEFTLRATQNALHK